MPSSAAPRNKTATPPTAESLLRRLLAPVAPDEDDPVEMGIRGSVELLRLVLDGASSRIDPMLESVLYGIAARLDVIADLRRAELDASKEAA